MSPKQPCMALDLRSVLARPTCELRGFTDAHGAPISPRQARAVLSELLTSGNELLTICITSKLPSKQEQS
jgi:hypothetical protein